MKFSRLSILLWSAQSFLLQSLSSAAPPWPKNTVVAENSTSPNGTYGVLVVSHEAGADDGPNINYLADLKARRVLGPIRGSDYFQGENHSGFSTIWAPDSSWGIVEYDSRFGFSSIFILEPEAEAFNQTDLGGHVQKSLDAVIARQSRDPEAVCFAGAYIRIAPGRKVRLRAIGTDNPKQLDTRKSDFALFQGTYDMNAKRWTVADVRPITAQEDEDLETAYQKALEPQASFGTVEEKAKSLDDTMNRVYRAVRDILPAERFAAIKQEQIAWLKTRDESRSAEGKCRLMETRIKELQELLW